MLHLSSIKTKYLKKLDIHLYNLQKKFPLLRRLDIEVTRQCNLKCKHCYMDAIWEKGTNEMTKEELFLIAYTLKKEWYKNIEIVFTGWEPLIRKDFIEIAQYYKKLWFQCFLVTNGTFLTQSKLETIQDLFTWFTISIDGWKDYHNEFRWWNSFDITIANIRHIVNRWNNLTIKTVITKDNIIDLENIYILLQKLGIKKWHIINLSSNGRWKKLSNFLENDDFIKIQNLLQNITDIEIFWENPLKKEQKRCICWISECAILYNWDVIWCLNSDRSNTKIYWNVKNNHIIDIWNCWFQKYRDKNFYHCND